MKDLNQCTLTGIIEKIEEKESRIGNPYTNVHLVIYDSWVNSDGSVSEQKTRAIIAFFGTDGARVAEEYRPKDRVWVTARIRNFISSGENGEENTSDRRLALNGISIGRIAQPAWQTKQKPAQQGRQRASNRQYQQNDEERVPRSSWTKRKEQAPPEYEDDDLDDLFK